MSKTKVTMTPQQVTDKWGKNLKASTPYIIAGVNAVTESPTEKAALAVDKYGQGVMAAIASGRYQKGLRDVSLNDWRTRTVAKVQTNLASGVDAAQAKHLKFATWSVTTLNQILPTINGMPNMTLEDSINRANAYMRAMAERPYKG